MGFRLYRRIPGLCGICKSLSRSGPSVSVGVRGAHVTVVQGNIAQNYNFNGAVGASYGESQSSRSEVHGASEVHAE